jgi:hypothetical protein
MASPTLWCLFLEISSQPESRLERKNQRRRSEMLHNRKYSFLARTALLFVTRNSAESEIIFLCENNIELARLSGHNEIVLGRVTSTR